MARQTLRIALEQAEIDAKLAHADHDADAIAFAESEIRRIRGILKRCN